MMNNKLSRMFRGWKAERELDRRRAAQRETVAKTVQASRPAMQIGEVFQERMNLMGSTTANLRNHGIPERMAFPVQPYTPPKGIAPAEHILAMDNQMTSLYGPSASMFTGLGFPGFPYLTELTQITEYRDMSERASNEMVRKWIKFRAVDGDKTERIKIIEAAMKRYGVREHFRQAAILDGFMGRAQLFIDIGESEGPELKTPLLLNQFKVAKGKLRGFKLVEPITTYPAAYSSTNPLASNYYVPSSWFVYGQEVHHSRLLTFVSRPVPDLLKPAYNFSGMSLSQLGQPYVDYWLSTRDSVGKLLRNFSTTVLKTDLGDALTGGSGALVFARARMFTQFRDNQGIFLLDGSRGEELTQVNIPLAGLDKLQAQAQEHMAAVAKTPLVILLGITPSGLNPSADADIRVFYSYIADQQEAIFRKNLETVIKVIQLSEFGEVDEGITFDFASLFEMSDTERANINKTNADESAILIDKGVVTPEETRDRLASNPDSGWNNLAEDVQIDPLTEEDPNAREDASAQAAQVASTASEPSGPSGDTALALDSAYMLMLDAVATYEFYGNKHTGVLNAKDDSPVVAAQKHSSYAQAATNAAKKSGKASDREAAANAHRRAYAAHSKALADADTQTTQVHRAFMLAHEAAIEALSPKEG